MCTPAGNGTLRPVLHAYAELERGPRLHREPPLRALPVSARSHLAPRRLARTSGSRQPSARLRRSVTLPMGTHSVQLLDDDRGVDVDLGATRKRLQTYRCRRGVVLQGDDVTGGEIDQDTAIVLLGAGA